jgi:hypothetical protein
VREITVTIKSQVAQLYLYAEKEENECRNTFKKSRKKPPEIQIVHLMNIFLQINSSERN